MFRCFLYVPLKDECSPSVTYIIYRCYWAEFLFDYIVTYFDSSSKTVAKHTISFTEALSSLSVYLTSCFISQKQNSSFTDKLQLTSLYYQRWPQHSSSDLLQKSFPFCVPHFLFRAFFFFFFLAVTHPMNSQQSVLLQPPLTPLAFWTWDNQTAPAPTVFVFTLRPGPRWQPGIKLDPRRAPIARKLALYQRPLRHCTLLNQKLVRILRPCSPSTDLSHSQGLDVR